MMLCLNHLLTVILFGTIIVPVLGYDWTVVSAQTLSPGHKVQVSGRVGEYYLDISGEASPYASIIMTSNGVFYRTAVADERGKFSITGILIRKGFSNFCLKHVDFRRIGESEACLSIPPATGSVKKDNLFLPPTIGLQRSQIEAGSDAVTFGYSMPGSTVTINIDRGQKYTVTADQNGYYEVTLENLRPGVYQLYATAVYETRPSIEPSSKVTLTALSWWQMIMLWVQEQYQRLVDILTGLGLGPLWLIFPLIPLITYLILRIWPERFTFITSSPLYGFLFRRHRKKLHHAWFKGVGY